MEEDAEVEETETVVADAAEEDQEGTTTPAPEQQQHSTKDCAAPAAIMYSTTAIRRLQIKCAQRGKRLSMDMTSATNC